MAMFCCQGESVSDQVCIIRRDSDSDAEARVSQYELRQLQYAIQDTCVSVQLVFQQETLAFMCSAFKT